MAAQDARTEDRAVVEAVLAGDPGAYRFLVERYQSRVYALICGMLRDREEARDLTQETFIRAFNNLDRFRLESSFYTWLYRIGMNLAIDHTRKHGRVKSTEFDEGIAAKGSDGAIDPSHNALNPARALERKRLHHRIHAALEDLSPEHRQIILLREVEGLSYKEISDTLELPEGTVMSRLFYARKRLQHVLRDDMPS